MNDQTITLIIVLLTYAGVALGFLPRLRADRTTIALIGVGVLLVFDQVSLADIPGFLDIDTLVLLFSMMVINSNLRLAGFFKLTGVYLLRMTREPREFLLIEVIVVGILSALFLNDTICIMFTPFLLELLVAIDRNPIPYLIALATAANIGSVATLTGNPQNMIIGSASGISYTQFVFALAPIAVICLGIVWIVLVLMYKQEFSRKNYFNIPPPEEIRYYKPLLVKSLIIVIGMLIAFIIGVPVALASFIAACVLMITRRIKPEKIFAGVDWGILTFFAALFIITGALEKNDVTTILLNALTISDQANALSLSLITAALSNLVSNVPAVMLLKPLVSSLSNPTAGWLTLAASSTLAGNLTLLGSVANLIVAESAKRRKIVLSFWEYTKSGLIITLLTMVISTAWLAIFIWN
jgi:Na+/H+ antiporter NhaD/arsenite permease-like protein